MTYLVKITETKIIPVTVDDNNEFGENAKNVAIVAADRARNQNNQSYQTVLLNVEVETAAEKEA